jgi:hypothetical protein
MSTLMSSGWTPLCARPAATCWRHQDRSPVGRPDPLHCRAARLPGTTARMLVRQAAQPGHSRIVRPLPHHLTA